MDFRFIFLILLNIWVIQAIDLECPSSELIYPCSCFTNGTVLCYGSNFDESDATINQNVINNLFSSLRKTNNLTASTTLYLYEFRVQYTNLTELDLTPLKNSYVDYLYVLYNPNLSNITGPYSNNNERETIDSRVIKLSQNSLTDQGLKNFLQNFVPATVASLDLSFNNLEGSPGEFLPGLSSLTRLYRLYLNNNKIKDVSGGQFQTNNRLGSIDLQGNEGIQFGSDAFLLNPPDFDVAASYIVVNLTSNGLSDSSFKNSSQLDNIKRPISLELQWNKFEFLSQENFEPYLLARSGSNMIFLQGNPLICDSRMRWLKQGRDVWENLVRQAYCMNDMGRTVFTSALTD